MNKKALNGILVLLVSGVWMVVFYRIWASYSHATAVESPDSIPAGEMELSVKRDTFSLLEEYRDPFLGATAVKKKSSVAGSQQSAIKKTPEIKKEKTPWPAIKFLGIVKNNSSNQSMALLNIAGKELRMRTGDMHNEIHLDKIYKDSILVSRAKELKMIRK